MPISNDRERTDLHMVLPSSQLRALATRQKGVLVDDVQLQARHLVIYIKNK